MSDEHNVIVEMGSLYQTLTPRALDAMGRLIPISDEERRARLPLELASLNAAWDIPADETETDERWHQIMRNLGVDPATGRGLEP